MSAPLAERLRPRDLGEVCGQQHLLAPGSVFRGCLEGGMLPNMIFYGPSGVGKTTVARILAERSNKKLFKLNGTSASTGDIKSVIASIDTLEGSGGILLYLDEIQYLNKKQQQSLLECIEDGSVTLIASTTENPYFYVYNALLSRSTVFEFKPLSPADVLQGLRRAMARIEELDGSVIHASDEALETLAQAVGGDMRKALGCLEFAAGAAAPDEAGVRTITADMVRQVAQRSNMKYDKSDDNHYDAISALQKSIRGSDPDAAVHYLARILVGGDLLSACRRLLVIAAEDVGLAYPQAIPIVKACVDSALQLGLPEARLPLADAAILLATAPKSNSGHDAIAAAWADVEAGKAGPVPRQLQNKHFDGADAAVKGQNYLYPHAFPNHWVQQQYLPDNLVGTTYYEWGENKTEQAAKAYWDAVKGRANGKK
ncbi:MAG: replication-associated recombination protein A [Oscillospiraceae bacterium]|nr:replication-associated recombination protein A [Oscillospiraceae bacterium]